MHYNLFLEKKANYLILFVLIIYVIVKYYFYVNSDNNQIYIYDIYAINTETEVMKKTGILLLGEDFYSVIQKDGDLSIGKMDIEYHVYDNVLYLMDKKTNEIFDSLKIDGEGFTTNKSNQNIYLKIEPQN